MLEIALAWEEIISPLLREPMTGIKKAYAKFQWEHKMDQFIIDILLRETHV